MVKEISLNNLWGARGNQGKELVLGDTTIYFSYSTPVAYITPGEGLVISENVWSVTTGGHLNAIDEDKSLRIPNEEFETRLKKLLEGILI